MESGTRFVSKVDTWLAVVLIGSLLLLVGSTILFWFVAPPAQRWIMMGSLGLVLLLTFGLVIPIYYDLEQDVLLVRSGWLRTRVPYAKITKVEPSNNPLSSPALSLDRLHVHVEDGFGVLISPKEREAFLQALLQRCPHLRREGERLERSR
ncbi:MAG: PH domain-containing protein [Myxococcales bacterium]|nr:PH domain-containing protein [Myxococcales bacterium]MCB9641548.1 PH domain-containing protein [Myxococcales bacterium]